MLDDRGTYLGSNFGGRDAPGYTRLLAVELYWSEACEQEWPVRVAGFLRRIQLR